MCTKYWFLLLVLIGVSVKAYGANLAISPVHLHLNADNYTEAFTIRNQSSKTVLMQTNVVKWLQVNGEDRYKDTNAIIINPPIFSIAPHTSQVVRVGLRHNWVPPATELTYRVYVQEVATHNTQKSNLQIQTLLRFGLPLFIAPAQPQPLIKWKIGRDLQGKLQIQLLNEGNVHIQVSKLTVDNKNNRSLLTKNVFAYVLPQQYKIWHLALPAYALPTKIMAQTNLGIMTTDAKTAV